MTSSSQFHCGEDVKFFEQVTGRSYAAETAKDNDAEALALHEIVSGSKADWEPYVTNGDWRRALDAWFTASIELRDYSYVIGEPSRTDYAGRNWKNCAAN
ncbi:hypothetical protein H7I87_18365 [Mycobacterium timonense]|uniref:Uncharacterized protein n=1 Tax=Mycobacterium bouchedurhonense TaxID=701041 RepID=A0AAW5S8D1_MYCBC|nr:MULTISPECIES: hypothetical protein [Mycobacterium avium complex (MAC)]MCV6991810.1 hypothetical protein [Mycobacterium bouchedurhonense]MCV6996647.1 hypothetical protein [Mycobacterium timonense]